MRPIRITGGGGYWPSKKSQFKGMAEKIYFLSEQVETEGDKRTAVKVTESYWRYRA